MSATNQLDYSVSTLEAALSHLDHLVSRNQRAAHQYQANDFPALADTANQLADLWQVLADEVRNTYTATVETLEEVA